MNPGGQLAQFHQFKFNKNLDTQHVKGSRKEVQKSPEKNIGREYDIVSFLLANTHVHQNIW